MSYHCLPLAPESNLSSVLYPEMRYGTPSQGGRRNLEGFPPYPKGD